MPQPLAESALREIGRDWRAATLAGHEPVPLSPTEFRLLGVLAANADRVVSNRFLLQSVWGKDYEACSSYLRVYIRALRLKIEPDPDGAPRMIVTSWGYGYRLTGDGRREVTPMD